MCKRIAPRLNAIYVLVWTVRLSLNRLISNYYSNLFSRALSVEYHTFYSIWSYIHIVGDARGSICKDHISPLATTAI